MIQTMHSLSIAINKPFQNVMLLKSQGSFVKKNKPLKRFEIILYLHF